MTVRCFVLLSEGAKIDAMSLSLPLGGLALLLTLVVAPPSHAEQASRAMWVWEKESYQLVRDAAYRGSAIRMLHRAGVDRIYLYADAYAGENLIQDEPAVYRQAIRELTSQGIAVEALLGSWHLNTHAYAFPRNHGRALEMFERVFRFNAEAALDERFVGINFDIEPHLLPQWKTERDSLLRRYLDLCRKIQLAAEAAGFDRPIGPAIPFWWDGIEISWRGVRRPASEFIIDMFDYVALMSYRNFAEGRDGMIAHSRHELDYASRTGKRVRLGADIAPSEIAKITFDGHDRVRLESVLSSVEREFAEQSSFDGFAIHHFEAWRLWTGTRLK